MCQQYLYPIVMHLVGDVGIQKGDIQSSAYIAPGLMYILFIAYAYQFYITIWDILTLLLVVLYKFDQLEILDCK